MDIHEGKVISNEMLQSVFSLFAKITHLWILRTKRVEVLPYMHACSPICYFILSHMSHLGVIKCHAIKLINLYRDHAMQ